jgi:hypothetical protein
VNLYFNLLGEFLNYIASEWVWEIIGENLAWRWNYFAACYLGPIIPMRHFIYLIWFFPRWLNVIGLNGAMFYKYNPHKPCHATLLGFLGIWIDIRFPIFDPENQYFIPFSLGAGGFGFSFITSYDIGPWV